MIVPYNPHDSSEFYRNYYTRQDGDGLAVYSGRRVMDGSGFGSFFGGLAKKVGRTALEAAKNVATDIMNGGDLKSSATRGLKSFGGDALGDVFEAVSGKKTTRKRKGGNSKGGRKKRQRGSGGTIFD